MSRLNFSEDEMNTLMEKRRTITHEIRQMRERVDNFGYQRPHTQFNYRDPEPNFNKNCVNGVVCRLIQLKDKIHSTAIETAAGARV